MGKEWKDIGKGLIEVENGIPTRKVHPCTYHEANGHVMKVTHHPDGTSSAEIMQPRHYVCYDPTTGDIVSNASGFNLMAEVYGIIPISTKTKDGVDAVCVEVVSIPSDFKVNGIFMYKIDINTNELIKKEEVAL